ncbi:MAG: lysophospholipase [Bdellovibrionales bacterium]|nr:lysophospholipase [Bdellovibrionales bacterium]
MLKRSEGHFQSIDKLKIFFQFWECDNPLGTLIITHGLGEHSDCYSEFANRASAKNWNVFSWDLRGHGRSDGQRGFVDSFEDYEMDLSTLVSKIKESKNSPEPLILFGHSMGGLITLRHILSKDPSIYRAVCLSSPLLGIAVDVPEIKKKFAKTIGRLMPKLTLFNEIDYRNLVRDPEHLKTYDKDPLRQDRISPNLFLGILKNSELTLEQSARIELPLLLQISGKDKIVDASASETFYSLVKSKVKSFYKYDQSYHEIFNDLDKATVYSDFFQFLETQKGK